MIHPTTNFPISDIEMEFDTTIDIDTQILLLAASNHDISQLKTLLDSTPITIQDSETGFTVLHAAIAACEAEESEDSHVNGVNGHGITEDVEDAVDLERAADAVRLLIEHGAIWDALDADGETPGCMALRLGLDEIYQIVIDAGVREILQSHRLEEYAALPDDSDEELEISTDNGGQDESAVEVGESGSGISVDGFLNTDWVACAKQLLSNDGPNILIIGHCVELFESIWQDYSPKTHHIVESRPEMIVRMKGDLYEKSEVIIHEDDDAHDVFERLAGEEIAFDALFYNTHTQPQYRKLKKFVTEWLDQLLKENGRFIFLHVFGMERQELYDVYTKVSS